MAPSQPSLPTNRAFVVQFRTQPPGTPIAWDGRVEHVVSGQVMHFHAEDARRQRQDYVDNYLDDYHHHYFGGYPVGAGLAVVGTLAVGTAITASASQSLSCPMTPVVVGGYIYYQCRSTWYQPAYQGGQVTPMVVNPPQ